jgi:hypothetical protein
LLFETRRQKRGSVEGKELWMAVTYACYMFDCVAINTQAIVYAAVASGREKTGEGKISEGKLFHIFFVRFLALFFFAHFF